MKNKVVYGLLFVLTLFLLMGAKTCGKELAHKAIAVYYYGGADTQPVPRYDDFLVQKYADAYEGGDVAKTKLMLQKYADAYFGGNLVKAAEAALAQQDKGKKE